MKNCLLTYFVFLFPSLCTAFVWSRSALRHPKTFGIALQALKHRPLTSASTLLKLYNLLAFAQIHQFGFWYLGIFQPLSCCLCWFRSWSRGYLSLYLFCSDFLQVVLSVIKTKTVTGQWLNSLSCKYQVVATKA